MRSITCVFDTGASPNLIRAVSDPGWLDSIRQCDIPDIRSTPGTKLEVSETITLHLCMGELLTSVNYGVIKALEVPVFLGTTYIYRFIKSIHPAEREIVPYHSLPVPILMLKEAKRETKKNSTKASQGNEEVLVLLVTLVR